MLKDPKEFYQLYKAKTKERIGHLKGMDGSLIENGEEISKELSKYFLSVFLRKSRVGNWSQYRSLRDKRLIH